MFEAARDLIQGQRGNWHGGSAEGDHADLIDAISGNFGNKCFNPVAARADVRSGVSCAMDYQPHHRRYFTGRTCSLRPDAHTREAAVIALHRAEKILAEGRLLKPIEAMAVALKESRDKETLFSIARAVAWETGADQAEILCRLGERYPDFS